MLDTFREYIRNYRIFSDSEHVLLAVSGGIDSMVMANLFLLQPYQIAIAHCNFCLRGEESDADELFVEEFARINNIKFFSIKFDTKGYSEKNRVSIQVAARELRYSWFRELKEKYNFSSIALAHNLNDNNETIINNLARGTGLSGLTGMKPRSGDLARPLLFATREMIESYAQINNIGFREDRSNTDTKYTRNKIRHLVMPLLREINGSVDISLSETIERLSESEEILKQYFYALVAEISRVEKDRTIFDIEKIKALKPLRTHLFEIFRPFGVNPQRIGELIKIFNSETGSTITTGSHVLIKNRNELIAEKLHNINVYYEEYFSIESLANSRLVSAELLPFKPDEAIPDGKMCAVFDLDLISFPVIIRNWHHGDWFVPFGMSGSKKLSDFLTERKIPSLLKKKILVAESAGKIFWVIGERTDNRFAVNKLTKRILKLSIFNEIA